MHTVYLFLVWLHVVAACLWVGGMLFLVLVLVPTLRTPLFRDRSAALLYHTGLRLRQVGWAALGLLVLTGAFVLGLRGYGFADAFSGVLWQGPWGHALACKLLLVTIIIVMGAVHDFMVGPKAARLMEEEPEAPRTLRMRRAAGWMGRLNLLLSLIVVILAVTLPRGGV